MSNASPKRVLLFGASGTIGGAVLGQLLEQGYASTCITRTGFAGDGATIVQADITDRASIAQVLAETRFDAVISCIASRSGVPEDAWAIDYAANSAILKDTQAAGVGHFILLSAICVQKPQLAFQQAKLAFEAELQASGLTWSIIRPTAFFKSLSGQVARVAKGKPFLLFGNGELTRCKPISNADLARFIVSALDDPAKHNRILPIGGPGPAISPKEQGEMLFALLGKEPRYRSITPRLMDLAIAALSLAGRFSKRAAAKAEYARIGRYYATESMLVWDTQRQVYDADATPEFGEDTLKAHYSNLLALRRNQT